MATSVIPYDATVMRHKTNSWGNSLTFAVAGAYINPIVQLSRYIVMFLWLADTSGIGCLVIVGGKTPITKTGTGSVTLTNDETGAGSVTLTRSNGNTVTVTTESNFTITAFY